MRCLLHRGDVDHERNGHMVLCKWVCSYSRSVSLYYKGSGLEVGRKLLRHGRDRRLLQVRMVSDQQVRVLPYRVCTGERHRELLYFKGRRQVLSGGVHVPQRTWKLHSPEAYGGDCKMMMDILKILNNVPPPDNTRKGVLACEYDDKRKSLVEMLKSPMTLAQGAAIMNEYRESKSGV